MKTQALKAATVIIVMLAVATIFVDVVSAQQPILLSEKNPAPTKQDPPISFLFFPFPKVNIHIKFPP